MTKNEITELCKGVLLCRSRRELSNAYFVAKFGLDTAENEPCQVCPTERSAPSPDVQHDAPPVQAPPGSAVARDLRAAAAAVTAFATSAAGAGEEQCQHWTAAKLALTPDFHLLD